MNHIGMSSQGNPKIVFIVPYPLGSAPGQRFRFEQYLSMLPAAGFRIKVFPFLNKKTNKVLYRGGHYFHKIAGVLSGIGRRILMLLEISSAHYVFIYREATPLGPPIFEFLIAKVFRGKIIYDFDDSIWIANTSDENKFVGWLKWNSKVQTVCTWSYKVSCGNQYLCDFARRFNSNIVFNPTTIDTQLKHNPTLFSLSPRDGWITIGWTGTHSTLSYLNLIEESLQEIEARFDNVRFLVIANRKPNLKLRRLEFILWNESTEIQDLLKIDIGLMPVPNDAWSLGKCGFKILQYLSLEIPAIASPVGVNSIIISEATNGFLAASKDEWIQKLALLILNPALRKKIGMAGRRKVQERYSVESNSSNFLSLFE